MSFEWISLPGANGARAPLLYADNDKLITSWVKKDGNLLRLQMSPMNKNGWSSVITVAEGDGWLANPLDYAQVIPFLNEVYFAVWLELTSFRNLSYRFKTRVSKDEGRSWTDTCRSKELVNYGEHGFATAGLINDEMLFYWASTYRGVGSLLIANISLSGQWSAPQIADKKVCICCRLVLIEFFLLAYRDRSYAKIRDISVLRDAPVKRNSHIVNVDSWKVSGCQVSAPAIAQVDDLIALS